MSVILKALRAQNDEGGDSQASQDVSQSSQTVRPEGTFQVDETGNVLPDDSPKSRKRQIILLTILLLAIVAFVVLQNWSSWTASAVSNPVPVPVPTPVAVAPVQVAPKPVEEVPVVPDTLPPPVPATNNDLQIARSQYKSGEYDDSLKSFQKAIDQDPNNASIHNDMGLVLLKKGLYASAEGHFAKALELDDSCAECYNNLGYLKTALDQPVEAEKYLQKATVLKPDYPDPYFNLAVMYEKSGDVGKAVDYYQSYLKKIPKSDTELTGKIKSRIHDLSGD